MERPEQYVAIGKSVPEICREMAHNISQAEQDTIDACLATILKSAAQEATDEELLRLTAVARDSFYEGMAFTLYLIGTGALECIITKLPKKGT